MAAESEETARLDRLQRMRRRLDRTRFWCSCRLRAGWRADKCLLWGAQHQLRWQGADYGVTQDDLEWLKAQPGSSGSNKIYSLKI